MAAQNGLKVSLFVTCLVDQLYPEVGVSVVRVLRRLGIEVDFPKDQTCCGQPLFNSGFSREAEGLAKRVLASFPEAPSGEAGEYVVVPSGSCAAMIRVFYPQLFRHDSQLHERSQELSGRVYEFSEFLVKVLGASDVGACYQGKVAYHPSCHLQRELGVSQEPKELIGHIEGAELVEMEDAETCCGFGGTFSVKYPHISTAMSEDKVESVAGSGASALVACDMGCLMQIGGALSRRGSEVVPMHLAQFLDSDAPVP